jgi:hypothetical protein
MDNGDYGHPDDNPRQWGNNEGTHKEPVTIGKKEAGLSPTSILYHGLQHSDYEKMTNGGVKDVGSITKRNGGK